jgi:hypothetical protein
MFRIGWHASRYPDSGASQTLCSDRYEQRLRGLAIVCQVGETLDDELMSRKRGEVDASSIRALPVCHAVTAAPPSSARPHPD